MRRPDYAVWGFDFRVLVLSLVALVALVIQLHVYPQNFQLLKLLLYSK